ncbi:MAG: hypothetical protein ACXWQR_20660 [Ktedonobacterales bacterium]
MTTPTSAIYDFTPYEVNRVARIAPEQRYWLGNSLRMTMFLCAGFSLILLFLLLADVLRSGLRSGLVAVVIPCVSLCFWQFITSLRRLNELAEGRVIDGVGRLDWHFGVFHDVYVAEIGERRIFCPLTTIRMLLPGQYRLFYLPQTRTLIAAERIEEPPPHFDLLKRLSEACDFTFAALAANRTEQLAPEQRKQNSPPVIFMALVQVAGLVVVDFIFLKILGDDWATYVIPVLALYIFSPFVVMAYIRHKREQRRRPVSVSEGQVRKLTYEVEYVPTHFFEIDGKRFRVPEAAFDVLDESLPYRVYHLPHGNRLLSIEPLAS